MRPLETPIALGAGKSQPTRAWIDLLAAVDRASSALEARGWNRPLVFCRDRYCMAVGLMACWARGLEPTLPPNGLVETIRAVSNLSSCDGILHDQNGLPGLDLTAIGDCEGSAGVASMQARYEESIGRRDSRPLVTIFSSGTTGAPVPFRKTALQLLGEAEMLVETFGLAADARVLATAPPHHIYGLLFGVLVPMVGGGAFVRDTPLHAEPLSSLVERCGANVLCAVPPHLEGLNVLADGALAGLGKVFCSGGKLGASVAGMMRAKFGLAVTEVFGSSETGGIAWRIAGRQEEWTPLPGVSASRDEEGALLVDSPFVDNERPYRTRDRVEMAEAGRFRHLGRIDAIVKVGGERVSLTEIEQCLREVDGVLDAAVLAVEDAGPRGHELCAVVVAPDVGAGDIRKALRARLDPIAIPRRIKMVDTLPRNATGKLPRRDLLALFESSELEKELIPMKDVR